MDKIWHEALDIWQSGGWAMIVLAVNAFILFTLGLSVKVRLWGKDYRKVSNETCRSLVEEPSKSKGPKTLKNLVSYVMKSSSLQNMAPIFKEFHHDEIAPFSRDLRIMRVCVGTAPLLGLLGTVSGMLTMFHALAIGSGGEKTLAMVATGISEALVTTETGLIIALPGLFFAHHLQQEIDRYGELIARLETGCAQSLQRMFSRRAVVSDAAVSTAAA